MLCRRKGGLRPQSVAQDTTTTRCDPHEDNSTSTMRFVRVQPGVVLQGGGKAKYDAERQEGRGRKRPRTSSTVRRGRHLIGGNGTDVLLTGGSGER